MDLASALRSLARRTTVIALDIYDRLDSASLLPLLATVVPNPTLDKVVTLEWLSVFPLLKKWIGERQVQKAFVEDLQVRPEKFEITYEFDKNEAERAESLFKLEAFARAIAAAFPAGKVEMGDRVLRENPVAYDGQNLFDTDHVHPDGTAYSNIVVSARANAAVPTVVEARSELQQGMIRLVKNSLIRNTLVSAKDMNRGMVVISRSTPVFQAYNTLLTEDEIDGNKNIYKGTFNLIHSFAAAGGGGAENWVDMIHALDGGPRPVVFVATREPNGTQFDESKLFSHALVPFGMDAEFGVAAGFPQPTVRIKQA